MGLPWSDRRSQMPLRTDDRRSITGTEPTALLYTREPFGNSAETRTANAGPLRGPAPARPEFPDSFPFTPACGSVTDSRHCRVERVTGPVTGPRSMAAGGASGRVHIDCGRLVLNTLWATTCRACRTAASRTAGVDLPRAAWIVQRKTGTPECHVASECQLGSAVVDGWHTERSEFVFTVLSFRR